MAPVPGSVVGYSLSLVLIVSMAGVAALLGHRELLFPEYGALCAGAFVHRIPAWRAKLIDVVLYPALAALIGVVLNRVGVPSGVGWSLSLAAVLVLMRLGASAMVPSISAGLLPILLHFTSFLYPVAVVVTTSVLAVAMHIVDRAQSRPAQPPQPALRMVLLYWALVSALGAVAISSDVKYAAAPPLMVAVFELLKSNGAQAAPKTAVLAAAAVIGVAAHVTLVSWPLTAAVSVIGVMVASKLVKVVLPPAYALGLLPMLVPGAAQWRYAIEAAAGSAVTVGLAVIWLRAAAHTR